MRNVVLGVVYATPLEVASQASSIVGRGRVAIVRGRTDVPRRRVYVVVGVRALKKLSSILKKTTATVIVLDSLERLKSVRNIVLLDADTKSSAWTPRPINIALLKKLLARGGSSPPEFTIDEIDVLSNLISEVRARGVLDKVLTLSHKIVAKTERERVFDVFLAFIVGKTTLRAVEKLRPTRKGTALAAAFQELVDSLTSEYGKRLAMAVKKVYPTFAKEAISEASKRYDVDAFELNYIATLAHKSKVNKKHAPKR